VRKIKKINYQFPYYDNLSRLDHFGTWSCQIRLPFPESLLCREPWRSVCNLGGCTTVNRRSNSRERNRI